MGFVMVLHDSGSDPLTRTTPTRLGSFVSVSRDALRDGHRGRRSGRVQVHAGMDHLLEREGELPVPELADVVVAINPIGTGGALPAEEDVTAGLHEVLAGHHAVALVVVHARGLSLLGLQEQRLEAVSGTHEQHPGAGPDAADPDDLGRDVGEANRPVKTFPLSVRICSGMPWVASASTNASHTGPAVALATTLAETTNRELSSIPDTTLTSTPLARWMPPSTSICHSSIGRPRS